MTRPPLVSLEAPLVGVLEAAPVPAGLVALALVAAPPVVAAAVEAFVGSFPTQLVSAEGT